VALSFVFASFIRKIPFVSSIIWLMFVGDSIFYQGRCIKIIREPSQFPSKFLGGSHGAYNSFL
jgi:hypothetical protein